MSWRRCYAVFLRYFYLFAKMDQIADLLYWPAVDILIWGLTTSWIQSHETGISNIALVVMTGLIFWQIVWRGNYEISVNLLNEFWNRNLVNLFSTPLRLIEWVFGVILLSLLKIGITLAFGLLAVYLLYELNIFSLGWAFLPFVASVMMSGWFIGFFAAAIVIYWGQRFQMLAWMTAYTISPFSAVFYPVTTLPCWAQKVAWCLPTTYIFEGMRGILQGGPFPWSGLFMSYFLNLVFLAISISVFYWSFEKSRSKGLARFE